VRALMDFGRWVVGGTMVTFVAQQFHVLYLGKFLPLAILGVYQVAWSFCAQASKPLTVLANRVVIPHFAEFQRRSPQEHGQAVHASLLKYLPACLLVCVSAGLFAPALFGFFYQRAFVDGGRMGRLLAVVVWFMVLQHVPRSALLSLGASRGVAVMALGNALLTVLGIVAGYTLGGGSVPGAIWGNALGNVAGCLAGWLALRGRGLAVGRPMVLYSLAFLALSWVGAQGSAFLEGGLLLSARAASLISTALIGGVLALWVWRRTLSPLLAERGR
jgi:O-antigen/teichoic acid export membrane protein